MDRELRNLVRSRAADRCEYCGIHQDRSRHRFHIEHIVARQHDGTDDGDNLAVACHHCNLHKGPNLSGIDPTSLKLTPLFHPRRDAWRDHFELRGGMIVGLTAVGRATIHVLNMNHPTRVEQRRSASDE